MQIEIKAKLVAIAGRMEHGLYWAELQQDGQAEPFHVRLTPEQTWTLGPAIKQWVWVVIGQPED